VTGSGIWNLRSLGLGSKPVVSATPSWMPVFDNLEFHINLITAV
jgi:hypothetical protein